MRNRPGELFADHLILELVVLFNCLHFIVLLVASVLDHRKYLYFSLAFTSAGKLGDLLKFVALFLLPTILAVVFALLLNAASRKPAWLRKSLSALCAVTILASMAYAILCSAVFTSMMPFASHTAKPEYFGKYDEKVMANIPTQNCPVSITAVPDGAQDFRYSYTFVQTVDYEWTVKASYTMERGAYETQKAAMDLFPGLERKPGAAGHPAHLYDLESRGFYRRHHFHARPRGPRLLGRSRRDCDSVPCRRALAAV